MNKYITEFLPKTTHTHKKMENLGGLKSSMSNQCSVEEMLENSYDQEVLK